MLDARSCSLLATDSSPDVAWLVFAVLMVDDEVASVDVDDEDEDKDDDDGLLAAAAAAAAFKLSAFSV